MSACDSVEASSCQKSAFAKFLGCLKTVVLIRVDFAKTLDFMWSNIWIFINYQDMSQLVQKCGSSSHGAGEPSFYLWRSSRIGFGLMQCNVLINLDSVINIPAEDAWKREHRVVSIAVLNFVRPSIYI